MAISPTYGSPGLRWGLALHDYPEAFVVFDEATSVELGIPERMSGGATYCRATIVFPEESKKSNAVGYKPIPDNPRPPKKHKQGGSQDKDDEHISDLWNILCTKALGRALKRAGYPDDIPDLKALTVWRMRSAQILALQLGNAEFTMGLADAERAIDEAGKVERDSVSSDDTGGAPDTETQALGAGDQPEAETTSESKAEIRRIMTALGPEQSALTAWCKDQKYRITRPHNEVEAQHIIAEGRRRLGETAPLSDAMEVSEVTADQAAPEAADETPVVDPFAEPEPDPTEDAAELAELLAGLEEDQVKSFWAFAKTIEIPEGSTPVDWNDTQRVEARVWLEV